MSLDPHLWEGLEERGVSEDHLRMLLTVLQLQRNGSWTWNVVNGHLALCDLRLVIPARTREVQRVQEVLALTGQQTRA